MADRCAMHTPTHTVDSWGSDKPRVPRENGDLVNIIDQRDMRSPINVNECVCVCVRNDFDQSNWQAIELLKSNRFFNLFAAAAIVQVNRSCNVLCFLRINYSIAAVLL